MQEIKTLDLKRTGIVPLNKLETFMLVEGTKYYYISFEGRLANDIKGKSSIYHIDGDNSNSKYNNLIDVSDRELHDLRNGKVSI